MEKIPVCVVRYTVNKMVVGQWVFPSSIHMAMDEY